MEIPRWLVPVWCVFAAFCNRYLTGAQRGRLKWTAILVYHQSILIWLRARLLWCDVRHLIRLARNPYSR